MNESIIQRIQNWYKLNCNGDWEHSGGLSINTMDNPGWEIKINLEDTALENGSFQKEINNGEDDWYIIKTENKIFIAYGDPNKLDEMLRIFLDEFLPSNINKNYVYEIYAPIKNLEVAVWRPVNAFMLNEYSYEIIEITKNVEKEIKFEDLDKIEKINNKINYEDIDYKVGDKVICELRSVFGGVIPIIQNKLT